MAGKTYIVEHLDDELGPWSELEYVTIAKESYEAGAKFCLSSVPSSLVLPEALKAVPGFTVDGRSVEALYADDKSRVCLLDPSATKELSPQDGDIFDVFLFGGILGKTTEALCKLELINQQGMIHHEARERYKISDTADSDNDIDRTSELRKKGFEGRRLGPKQMTTDTAVRVTRLVVQDKSKQRVHLPSTSINNSVVNLDDIQYVDYPELRINKNESTEMPFRYVKGKDGQSIMPEVSQRHQGGSTTDLNRE